MACTLASGAGGRFGDRREGQRDASEIEQIMIVNLKHTAEEDFERDLFIMRRRIENQVRQNNIPDFYICSMSCRSVIYKGLFLASS
jgi:glutamate synthase (NADPH/NADH) large chain